MERISRNKIFSGFQDVYRHQSTTCGTPMKFSVYLPPHQPGEKLPVLYWLSGLTCSEQNFIQKSGMQRAAAQHRMVVVACDTSPRGLGIAGEDDSYDLGTGAGFYVDATQAPWSKGYRMYSYVSEELPALIAANFPVDAERQGISGHSMGGHGALVIGLRNADRFKSISAFAPIAAPTKSPWGQKAFTAYLGDDQQHWAAYDAHLLAAQGGYDRPLLVDQGDQDEFLKNQLMPEYLKEACAAGGIDLRLRYQAGYDHSYYFIATFIDDHLAFHRENLALK